MNKIIATPIQDTPILDGDDAKRFKEDLRHLATRQPSKQEKEAKQKEIEEMERCYNLIASISGGPFSPVSTKELQERRIDCYPYLL